ncbi:MAG TPA: MBL fold metallo-hydrolase [Clostridiales bacterium]|nr:MBL fold metallo-hydrolase [Clostridiales bacterium]
MSLKICPLFSGSSGNATYIASKATSILVDAGLSGRRIQQACCCIDVDIRSIDAILISHEHRDHIMGAGILSRRYDIPIYATALTWEAMVDELGPVADKNIKIMDINTEFEIKDMVVKSYPTPHDAVQPVGFCFFAHGKKISITTDLGHTNDEVIKTIEDSDLVMLEANHDVEMLKAGPYPWHLKRRILSENGHLSNGDAGKTISKLMKGNLQRVILAHMSKENNFPELAYQTICNILAQHGIVPGKDIQIGLANRDRHSGIYEVV